MRKAFTLFLVAFVMLSGVVFNSETGKLHASKMSEWRQVEIRVASANNQINYGENYSFYVQILNTTKQVLELPLSGDCQISYRVRDNNQKIIKSPTESCVNFPVSSLILGPGEYETIDFEISDLEVGRYRAEVFIGEFEDLWKLDFVVNSKMEFISFEGGICGGVQNYTCATGLVCSHKSTPMQVEGTCVLPGQARSNVEIDFTENIRKVGLESSFPSFGYVSDLEFIALMKKYSNREILITSVDGYVSRDAALTAMYRTMIRSKHPEALEQNYFLDSKWSKYGNYIEEAADLGLIEVPNNKLFIPDGRLTWEEAEMWLSRFAR